MGVARDTAFSIHGTPFHADLYVMPLAGFDMVLGTQWLATLGPNTWDFTAHTLTFQRHGHEVCWHGLAGPNHPSARATTASPSLLDELLDGFADLFTEPQGLPPPRGRDHHIVLQPGSQPVAVRPYRYPATHKDELERQCATMLEQGLIRRSSSAFSSPVLLVKKADGS